MPLSAIEAFYVAIGLLSIAAICVVARGLYGRGSVGTSALEITCYLVSAGALLVGWLHWTRLLFVNPASASG